MHTDIWEGIAADFDRTTYTFTDRGEIATAVAPGPRAQEERLEDPDQVADRVTWTFKYDLRGNKVTAEDPDNGISTNEYDAAGQVTLSKDGRGRVLAFTYDKLGRKEITRKTSDKGPKLAEWEYDTLAEGVGKLTKATRYEYDAAGNVSEYVNAVTGYDVNGRPQGSSVTVPASETGLCVSGTLQPCTFTQKVNYRPNGALYQTVYPAVAGLATETVTTRFNEVGLTTGLVGAITYAQDVVYNQLDQVIGKNLGEQGTRVGLTYGIDEPTGRLITFNAAPELKSDVYNLAYKYDDAGTITSISDTPDGGQLSETQCFGYDYLRRLTEAWTPASQACAPPPTTGAALGGPAPYWRSYTYDNSGNRLTEVQHAAANTTRTYAYPKPSGVAGSRPHAVTSIVDSGAGTLAQQFGYDPAGNTTCRPDGAVANVCAVDGTAGTNSQGLTWNDEGRVAKSTDKTGDTTFVYDVDGNRLIRRDPAGSTLYLPGGMEIRKPKTGNAVGTRYYAHGEGTIAVRTPAGVTWTIDDHHGTGSATVSNDKNLTVTRRRTLPFGDVRGTKPAVWAGDKGFVGGTSDNTGLTHLGAREYDPAIGKFISVDPVMDLNDPEQWNAYTYSNSSPITMSDPSGLYWCATDVCTQTNADVNGCPGCTYDKPKKPKKSGRFSIGSPNPPRAHTAEKDDFKFDPLATPTFKDQVSLAKWQVKRDGCIASEAAGVGPCAGLGEAPSLYFHYMSADGGDKEIDFSHADEDPSIAQDVSREITQAQRAVEKLAVGEGGTFSITGDNRNIGNNPATEKWQKTLGSYNMWSSADVRVEGKTISMRTTIHAYDRWNFNKDAADIKSGISDNENGRFAQLGWAKGFNTSGTMVRDVVWTAGSASSTTVTEPWRPRW